MQAWSKVIYGCQRGKPRLQVVIRVGWISFDPPRFHAERQGDPGRHPGSQSDELFLACVTSKVTSDCLVDVLELGWQSVRERFEHVRTLVINQDNGPESQSHRTQFLNRLVAFAQTSQLAVKMAYACWQLRYS